MLSLKPIMRKAYDQRLVGANGAQRGGQPNGADSIGRADLQHPPSPPGVHKDVQQFRGFTFEVQHLPGSIGFVCVILAALVFQITQDTLDAGIHKHHKHPSPLCHSSRRQRTMP
jgi:hypothetical protein